MGPPWQCSGYDSALALHVTGVPFLVRELRSHMPCDMAKRKKKKKTADFSKDMEELKF